MNWQEYEKQVFAEIQRIYPNANIVHDTRLPGRFSRTTRQVDILISGTAAGLLFRTVVDTKFYDKKLDVKDIEQFIGMIEDLDCSHGMLITEKGFSAAAEYRAATNPQAIALDIVSFGDLSSFQTSGGAIAFTDHHAVTIAPPLGWAIDCRPEQDFAASLYNRSLKSREHAMKSQHFMYVMIAARDVFDTLDELIQSQEAKTVERIRPEPDFQYSDWKCSSGKTLRIRQIYIPGSPSIEVTSFVEFERFYCYVVLVMPLVYQHVDFPKLVYVSENLLPMEVKQDPDSGMPIAK